MELQHNIEKANGVVRLTYTGKNQSLLPEELRSFTLKFTTVGEDTKLDEDRIDKAVESAVKRRLDKISEYFVELCRRFNAVYVPIVLTDLILTVSSDIEFSSGYKHTTKMLHSRFCSMMTNYRRSVETYVSSDDNEKVEFVTERINDHVFSEVSNLRVAINDFLLDLNEPNHKKLATLETIHVLLKIIEGLNTINRFKHDNYLSNLIKATEKFSMQLYSGDNVIDYTGDKMTSLRMSLIKRIQEFNSLDVIGDWLIERQKSDLHNSN